MIIKYFYSNGLKKFDVIQALKGGGWNIEYKNILNTKDLKLVNRTDPEHKETISSITLDKLFEMYFVSFVGGGWQCLDNAIDQFKKDTINGE